MAKAVTLMARARLFCKVHMHKHVHLQPAEIPALYRRFAHIHVYLVGLLPSSRSHTYLFTIIDRTSRWPEAIPLPSITAIPTAPEPCSPAGSPSSECRPPSSLTDGPSSRPPCGPPCVACSISTTQPQMLTTCSGTGWWKGSTGG
jgi:hypothetical protein